MEKFEKFRIDVKSIYGGKLITKKEIGSMHYPNGQAYNGVYISQFNSETGQYSYWDIIGNPLTC